MVYRVALVQRIRDDLGLWHVCNSRRDDVWHVTVVFVLCDVELGVRVELTDSGQVNITTVISKLACSRLKPEGFAFIPENGYPNRFLSCKVL